MENFIFSFPEKLREYLFEMEGGSFTEISFFGNVLLFPLSVFLLPEMGWQHSSGKFVQYVILPVNRMPLSGRGGRN